MNKYKNFGFFITIVYLIITVWVCSIEYVLANWYIFSTIMIAIVLITFIVPVVLKPFYIVWMFIGKWLGLINTFLIFTLIYFVIITPISALTKLFKKRGISNNSNWKLANSEPINFNKQF